MELVDNVKSVTSQLLPNISLYYREVEMSLLNRVVR